MSRIEVLIVGIGGMGIVLAGRILSRAAAIYEGKEVVQTQSYGAEARGTAARSEIIISDKKINYPRVRRCDILVAMSQEGLEKYLSLLKEDGVLVYEKYLVKKIPTSKRFKVLGVPAIEIAEKRVGNRLAANVVIISAMSCFTDLISKNSLKKAIVDIVPKAMREVNLKAVEEGIKFLKTFNEAN